MSSSLVNVHTIYSILDGINKIKPLIEHVKSNGMSACAITDHGVLHGIIDFYKEAREAGVKPIIGCEVYITNDEDGIEDNKNKTRDNYHLILLVQNKVGLRNLYWMINQANLYNFYYRPRIYIKHLLDGRSEGLIATSSCLGSYVAKVGTYDKGNRTYDGKVSANSLGILSEVFQDRFYAEIQDNPGLWQQNAYNAWLIKEAKAMRIPTVITADAHWLTRDDKDIHDLIMAQQMKCSIQEYQARGDEDGMFYDKGHYIRSPDEMFAAAIKYNLEESFWNTTEIIKNINLEIEIGEYKSPIFDVTKENDYQDFLSWKKSRIFNDSCCG